MGLDYNTLGLEDIQKKSVIMDRLRAHQEPSHLWRQKLAKAPRLPAVLQVLQLFIYVE